ncbi:MAG: PEP/pyruvate-binding domain-containing protein [Lutisporaceae bacterium]
MKKEIYLINFNDYIADKEKYQSRSMGSKFKNLAEVSPKFNVPKALCITAEMFNDVLKMDRELYEYINEVFADLESTSGCFMIESIDKLERRISDLVLSQSFIDLLKSKMSETFGDIIGFAFAVRSSSCHEDTDSSSFAGVYETILDVKGMDNIIEALVKNWKAYYSYSAIIARIRSGNYSPYPDLDVIVQLMVDSKISGVAFSCDPDGSDIPIIEWVDGMGENLVSGLKEPSVYYPKGDNNEVGVEIRTILDDVAIKAQGLKEYFGYDVDMEWGWDGKQLYILQVRPVTTVKKHKVERIQKMNVFSLYTDNKIPNKAELGECKDIYYEYTNKRSPAYILAESQKTSTGLSYFVEFNMAGLEESFFVLAKALGKSDAPKIVIDVDKSIRQNIITKDELYNFMEKTFKASEPYEVHSMIIRDFIKGDYGFISQLLDGDKLLIESSKEGLLAINRGLVDCHEIIVKYDDKEQFDYEEVKKVGISEVIEQFKPEAVRKILHFTKTLNNMYANTKLEWVIKDSEPYFIDFSVEKNNIDYSGYGENDIRIIYPGIAKGPLYRISEEDIFSRLSISPGVSVTKTNMVVKSNNELTKLIDLIKNMEQKPIILCTKPYAILSFLLEHVEGFVFTEGSILCHLSILIREAKIPAIIYRNAEQAIGEKETVMITNKSILGVIE